jgi:RecA-family ATPase
MNNTIKLEPIERPPAYTDEMTVVDPSQLAGRDVPTRQWLVEDMIPAGKVILFTGDGGVGKSLLMQQLITATALGHDWLGIPTKQCRSFALFCEDDNEELHRRQNDICSASLTPHTRLHRMRWLSGVGSDNTLMQFDQREGKGKLTHLFGQLFDYWKQFEPGLIVIDTLADTFGGNEIIRPQVRTFINGCLGLICKEIGATVILCGHPSQSGKASGEGYSGSTAWNNSVRARLYLTKPTTTGDDDDDQNERVLATKKSNYGPSDQKVELRWRNGAFHPTEKLTGHVAWIEQNNHERTFLKCLDALAKRNSNVSDNRNSSTYAPKVMMKMPERERVKKSDLEKAMFSLFSKDEITNESYGPPSKGARRIVRATAGLSDE